MIIGIFSEFRCIKILLLRRAVRYEKEELVKLVESKSLNPFHSDVDLCFK